MLSVNSNEGNHFNLGAIIVLILAIFGVFIAPYLLSQPALFASLDFSEKANIGSYIGGTTAPVIGLVSAFLVYIAFRAQYLANKKQWDIIDKQQDERDLDKKRELLWNLISDVKVDFRTNQIELHLYKLKNKLEPRISNDSFSEKINNLFYDLISFQELFLEYEDKQDIHAKALFLKVNGITKVLLESYTELAREILMDEEDDRYNTVRQNNQIINSEFDF